MARERVTTDDLRFAIDWLDQYNDGREDDAAADDGSIEPNVPVARRVMAWLEAEIERREVESEVGKLLTAAGVTKADAKTKAKARRIVQARRASA